MPDLIVHGYYRYTDIWFEWAPALPDELEDMRYPLKAVLSYDALSDPNHPLRLPGKDGIELSIGTFENGEARLLFSSAQIEYIRYWLHAMHLTRDLVPMPYTECLIRRSSLQSLAPIVYKNAKALKSAVKDIDKLNKRIKKGGADTALTARRIVFERVRALWLENRGVWCAIDIETWERDHTALLEFGWQLARWEEGKLVEEGGHFIVGEYRSLSNTTYLQVPADRKNHYHYGESETLDKKEFKVRVNALLDSLSQHGPVFLVFHDASQDIKDIKGNSIIAAPLEGLSYILPDTCKPGLYVVDTTDLFGALEGVSHERRALERVCNQLSIPARDMHNAGNDAYCTLAALRSMVEGGALDMQRQQRWPNRTAGIKLVQKDEDDEDSDDGLWDVGPQASANGVGMQETFPRTIDVTEVEGPKVGLSTDLYAGPNAPSASNPEVEAPPPVVAVAA